MSVWRTTSSYPLLQRSAEKFGKQNGLFCIKFREGSRGRDCSEYEKYLYSVSHFCEINHHLHDVGGTHSVENTSPVPRSPFTGLLSLPLFN